MTETNVLAERVKTIRKARKIGRPKLSKLVGVTERQVTRIETGQMPVLPEALALRLSDALQVPVQALTGDVPLTDADLTEAPVSTCTSGCCG
ncbi:hypothetical protein JANAI62_15210 [Jannaschia pagri]|uniref:HTH cro/C1-type domain-containing protein n=1 Tax=Jannaschia pagri TaxID=2829797 RepID=A0ABQ4NKG5_9RHOB|nr:MULTISPECIES: helix-turn-helix transcriptional regulator [unclassified Jannaschia]GIT91066.1 hypothetical protein JANAI61_15240 [Jannaschia sp. AI_61]GIT94898.1 hypothetical protein JANAI62_15210 [Jannaschia sp. AI_62]